jgi:hypothetical protein
MYPVFGVYLVAFRFRALVVVEMVLIAIGTILCLLAVAQRLLEFVSRLSLGTPTPPAPSSQTTVDHPITWTTFTNAIAHISLRGYGRFLLAIILGTGAQVGLVVGFLGLNPNVCSFLYL